MGYRNIFGEVSHNQKTMRAFKAAAAARGESMREVLRRMAEGYCTGALETSSSNVFAVDERQGIYVIPGTRGHLISAGGDVYAPLYSRTSARISESKARTTVRILKLYRRVKLFSVEPKQVCIWSEELGAETNVLIKDLLERARGPGEA